VIMMRLLRWRHRVVSGASISDHFLELGRFH